jgi:hypothetical protein
MSMGKGGVVAVDGWLLVGLCVQACQPLVAVLWRANRVPPFYRGWFTLCVGAPGVGGIMSRKHD